MESEFNNWYEKWTGSKVKCENTDIIGAWQHQQSKIDKLQANFDQHDQWLGQRNRDVQELSDIIAKHAAEKNELQKRFDELERDIKWAVTFVDLQIEATEQGREAAIRIKEKNCWSSKLLMLRPVRRALEQALKGWGK